MKYDSKTKTMDYTKKEKEHVFSSFPKGKSTPRSKALKKDLSKMSSWKGSFDLENKMPHSKSKRTNEAIEHYYKNK